MPSPGWNTLDVLSPNYLLQLLTPERGYYFTTSAETEIVRDIKETLCFVSKDFVADMKGARDSKTYDQRYILPDGQLITIGSERFRCPEVLFRPSFLNLDGPGFQGTLYDAVMKCDVDIRRHLGQCPPFWRQHSVSRNSKQTAGEELQDLCPSKVRCGAPAERRYAVWLGGSILGSLSTFQDICISQKEYDDYGPKIVHRKCF
ncbi:actin-2 [Caerostris extrusa]|uniref:Actin-2 n=1 Tax=Caerostris extrusa TaxID=172846 RepID=A0AAV4PK64_CAEEX|nr:actin-2 [Caerostris extrusa]